MPKWIKGILIYLMRKTGFVPLRVSIFDALEEIGLFGAAIRWLPSTLASQGLKIFVLENLAKSRSQLQQDLFVLFQTSSEENLSRPTKDFKRQRYFVEFGATNGIELSNTYLLEKDFGWQGIVCEPGKVWHHDLQRNRSCIIDLRCIFSDSGKQLIFNETEDAVLSTIDEYSDSDTHTQEREIGNKYFVDTISLNDLLLEHDAPDQIDYLSIDTEGSELLILESFNFSLRKISIITVEHNYSENREKIYELLVGNGYKRILEDVSAWDDWYILA